MSDPRALPHHPRSPGSGPREEEVRSEAREFANAHHLAERYRALDLSPEFPRAEWEALAGKGWLGPRVARELGGAGWSLSEEAALIEELAYEGGSVFAKLVLQPEFCSPLHHAGPELRDRWYRPLLKGVVLVGNQITEPMAGSDAAGLETRAERDGDTYVLHGSKSQIAFAADANAAIVYARTSPAGGARGISAILVPQDLPGVRRSSSSDLGERWMRRGTVRYDGVRVPVPCLIGQEGKGFGYLMEELTPERALLSLIYLAVARRSWEETRAHVMSRRAFSRPLGSFEGVSFPLMEDYVQMEAARLFAWQTLRRLEQGEKANAEAALSKAHANEVALRALEHAMQFHGGQGYSSDLPHEQRWRDVRSGTTAHGSTEVLKVVAARELLGPESLPYGKPSATSK